MDVVRLADFLAALLGRRLGELIVQLNLIQLERSKVRRILDPSRITVLEEGSARLRTFGTALERLNGAS